MIKGFDHTKKQAAKLQEILTQADAVLIGAGAGLSTSAGLTYSGERFYRYFSDFHEKYGINDMYSGGFYPYQTLEEYWAWWSRHIYYNRYDLPVGQPYIDLLELVKNKDYFILTNEKMIRKMLQQQKDMRIPTELIPRCPICGKPMTTNLRTDHTFVQDDGWYRASNRYDDFIRRHQNMTVVYLELGVGLNTPGIIKYNFWQQVYQNHNAYYVCINKGQSYAPCEIADRSICLDEDIGQVLRT